MPNRKYEAGRRAEYKVMRLLESAGWYTYRMASSKGEFDVIAWHPAATKTRFIQVKSGRPASSEDRRQLAALPMPECGCKELWEFLERGKDPRVTMFDAGEAE